MKSEKTLPPTHPGLHIKNEIIPQGMSVKDAAKILGVGRPALSALLNGHSSLSPEMILRLEKSFGADREELLNLQVKYTQYEMSEYEKDIAVRKYSPSFFEDVRAKEIEDWSENLETRALFPVLLRILVNTTGKDLSKVGFPAHENIQNPGWDGYVDSGSATPWVPRGISGWELSVAKKVLSKARQDYANRTEKTSPDERNQITFVFVTSRKWSGKDKWVKEQKDRKEWKDIRAYDASDLEQWLEQSVPAQAWLREKLGRDDSNILSLDQSWHRWSMVTNPPLNRKLFSDAVKTNREELKKWLSSDEEYPLIVVADSKDESVAFLSCALRDLGDLYYDKTLCVYSSDALKKIARANSEFIAIIASDEAEEAMPEVKKYKVKHMIIRNKAPISSPSISLEMPSYDCFKESLVSMGISIEEVPRRLRESGGSPTVLRRRLSDYSSISSPDWSKDKDVRDLIPFMLVGAWDAKSVADKEILSNLSDRGHKFEENFARFLQFEESPLWSISNYRRVVSKIDVLFLIYGFITEQDIERFFEIAEIVLSEKDPVLDLPEEDRWMANISGKTRKYSSYLREGLCETLVLLSVYGPQLFEKRLGINVQERIDSLIRGLLKTTDAKKFLSQQNNFPRYAEASPKEFLEILESDLRSGSPKISILMKPVNSAIFGAECSRTGLLWALELLAWEPKRLSRVAKILAQLSRIEIEDNWMNKPFNSLLCIFMSWMPQTRATLGQRIESLKYIVKKYPDIGWQLCMKQLSASQKGKYNYRPRWRNDAAGSGSKINYSESCEFKRKALDILLEWESQDEEKLTDLVDCLEVMNESDIEKVISLIDEWSDTNPDNERKAYLREQIRRRVLTHQNLDKETKNLFQTVYDRLGSEDLIMSHKWLFANGVAYSLSKEEDDFDYKNICERIESLRIKALNEIYAQFGSPGLKMLIDITEDSWNIGCVLSKVILSEQEAKDFLYILISNPAENVVESRINYCVSGFLAATELISLNEIVNVLIKRFREENRDSEILKLLMLSPYNENIWEHVEKMPEDFQKEYWASVRSFGKIRDPKLFKRLVDKLLEFDLPRKAFSEVCLFLDKIDSRRILSLLYRMILSHNEPLQEPYPYSHDVIGAFEVLNSRGDVSTDVIAGLEFLYLRYVSAPSFKTPNLEKKIADSPEFFVLFLRMAYKRSDGKEYPLILDIPNNQRETYAIASFSFLNNLNKTNRIPGADEKGIIDESSLKNWIENVRKLCEEYALKNLGDQTVGQILSSCSVGNDGIWPCEPVRRVIEGIESEDIAIGMSIGICNARGTTHRGIGDGGDQERDLAMKYRIWSEKLSPTYPYVAKLLEDIAGEYDRESGFWDTTLEIEKRTSL